jgi:hypothetical protein
MNIDTMDRRTFVLLSGAASGALLHSPRRLGSPRATPPVGRLMFTLDERQRWTLSYHGDAGPVPLIGDAELAVHIEDRWVPLHALERVTAKRRIGPDRRTTVVSGTAAGIAVDVAFADADPGTTAAITVALSPDRVQAVVRGIRYCALPPGNVLPGPGQLQALINGYHSWSESRLAPVPEIAGVAVSHAALGLSRLSRGLGLAFDPGEPGEAAVHLSPGALEARSDWLPARPLRSDGDAATLRFAFDPAGDASSALAVLFAPAPVDRDRFAVGAPAGWCSWYQLKASVTEADVIANLETCAAHFDPRFLRYVQIDDGYQRAAGVWETNGKFPHGHRWLTEQIHAKGFQAGLWVAPFAVTQASGIPAAHPDWLLRSGGAPQSQGTNATWGGTVYALDAAHPGARGWLRDLGRRVVHEWGYDYLKIDFLLYATTGDAHAGGATHAEAYRAGLAAIRDGMGPDAFLLGCGAPLQHAVGAVNAMRIGADVDATWGGIQAPARATALRSFYHRGTWLNDPDCLVVRPPLSLDEARLWTSIVALSGGMALLSDDLPRLPPDRIALLQRALPVAPIRGRAVDLGRSAPEVAPAIVAPQIDPIPLRGAWRFRAGDDARYAAHEIDDTTWEPIPVPRTWESSGHPGYDGFAWYRTRFTLPIPSPERSGGLVAIPAALELGRIDDTDETFVNGVKVGQTGTFPPGYRGAWEAFRRYVIPEGVLHWGGENTIAIRVYDGGGAGGLWSVRRDAPPSWWIAEAAPRWWTVALINWSDEPDDVAVPVDALGIAAERCAVYDVWADRPATDVADTIRARLEPHTALVLGLRAAAERPQVIGTTRHVVQGAIDIFAEQWDQTTRTLRVNSRNLDARPYAVTIAVPPGLEPGGCTAEIPCTVKRLPRGHAVIEWADGTRGKDVDWELRFQAGGARPGQD